MRINETTLRRIIRTLLEADGLETTDTEQAAKAAINPSPVQQPSPQVPTSGDDVSPAEAFANALARKMRKKGAPESTVTAMLDASKASS